MRFIADLHIHSHYSRATSRSLNPENLDLWARKKGIAVIGTGDFTHPGWVAELDEKLVEAEEGLYRLRPDLEKAVGFQVPSSCPGPTRFMLSGEISCIYKKGDKTRKVHHLILMPDMASVRRFNERLDRVGNITSDGRPILGLDSRDLLEMALEADERVFFIPAHVWTPWFSVFGSKSGFDSLEACFEDLTGHIHALETGLSSDPPMNRLLSALDRYLLVSNSDAHSPAKLGREANIFETTPDYPHMIEAMTTGEGFTGTVEFYPEEGKYHLDGHRKCGIRLEPEQTLEHGGVCPECGKPLTLGVLYRVAQLADRQRPKLSKAFFSLIPLTEILSQLLSCGPNTKKVATAYESLLSALGPEIHILMECPLEDAAKAGGPLFSEALDRMRTGRVIRDGGYDGEYGTIRVFEKAEMDALMGQTALFPGQHKIKPARKKRTRLPKKKSKKPMPLFGGKPIPAADPVLDALNPEQRTAVTHRGGHLLVKAGPGTGKTLTLTHRIAWLIREGAARPDRVLALTFTRKAAREMARRIEYLAGREAGEVIRVATFHRFFLDILRTHGSRIEIPSDFILASEADAGALCRYVAQEAGVGDRVARKFMRALPEMKMAAALGDADIPDPDMSGLFSRYRETLKNLRTLDMDDLECETLRLFRSCPEVSGVWGEKYPWLFVDEYQDTNMAQVDILKALVRSGAQAVCAIGDPDQAIYGFRGALVENFYRFETDFSGARVVALTRNYRSTSPILESAAAVMRNRALEPLAPEGSPLFVAPCRTEGEEAEMIVEQVERLIGGTSYFSLDSGRVDSTEGGREIGFGDLAVLFRLNAQGNALAEAFDRAGIPFIRSGEAPLISRFPVDVVWRFLQTRLYPENVHFERMYKETLLQAGVSRPTTVRDINSVSPVSEIIEQAVSYHNLVDLPKDAAAALKSLTRMAGTFKGGPDAFLDTLSLERGIDHETLLGDRVALMSLHAAKGLEWPVVFITGCEDGLVPCTLFGAEDTDEERRLFFVGMTRARNRLILSHAARRSLNGRPLELTPSPFLQSLPAAHVRPLERRAWKPKGPAHKQLGLFD